MTLEDLDSVCSCIEDGDCSCGPFACFCECECDGCLADIEDMAGCPCGGNCGCS